MVNLQKHMVQVMAAAQGDNSYHTFAWSILKNKWKVRVTAETEHRYYNFAWSTFKNAWWSDVQGS